MNEATTVPLPLLSARDVSKILGVTVRQIARLRAFGKMPKPFFVGRFPRWRADDIAEWIERGCPAQREWNAICAAKGDK